MAGWMKNWRGTRGALLAVDNCFCSPALQRPIEYGADLIIHSGTKYLDGQGRVMGLHRHPIAELAEVLRRDCTASGGAAVPALFDVLAEQIGNDDLRIDRKSTRLNSSH